MSRRINVKLLMARIDKTPDCWMWTGRVDRHGYGKASRNDLAHRLVYEALVGPIETGLELDHLCRVLTCVNPDHLEPVTHEENMRRRNAAYTHCKHGHEFTPENTYRWQRNGKWTRACRACNAATQRRLKAQRQGASA